jgi:hypothetical protein
MKFTFVILLFLLISACSENKPVLTLNEKNYLKTQDSLVKYKSDILENSEENLSDYMKLDYQSYKTKYQLSEKEMEITTRTFITRCEIVKAFKSIRENRSRSNLNQYHSKDSIKGNYSFDKNLKSADVTKDKDAKIMMKAFEEK